MIYADLLEEDSIDPLRSEWVPGEYLRYKFDFHDGRDYMAEVRYEDLSDEALEKLHLIFLEAQFKALYRVYDQEGQESIKQIARMVDDIRGMHGRPAKEAGVQLLFEPDMYSKIRKLADKEGKPVHEYICDLVEQKVMKGEGLIMNIDLKEMMKLLRQAENRGKKQKPEISVTIKAEGEEDITYKENFLVMYIGEDYGAVVGCLEGEEFIRAVDMLIDSVTEVIERMPPHEQMKMSMMLLDCIKEKIEEE